MKQKRDGPHDNATEAARHGRLPYYDRDGHPRDGSRLKTPQVQGSPEAVHGDRARHGALEMMWSENCAINWLKQEFMTLCIAENMPFHK